MISRIYSEILKAEERIRPLIRRTWVDESPVLSERSGARVFLKMENQQITGSFKLRGALNKVLSLDKQQTSRGLITASTGNHGLASAYAFRQAEVEGTIYLPAGVPGSKLEALRRTGVRLIFETGEAGDAESRARRAADEAGQVYISPYNDVQVIAGQGTLGLELDEQLPALDAVLVAVGGGGLISGIASYLKTRRPEIKIVGCLPANSPVMYECVKAGTIIEVPCTTTLSDGTAGAVEAGSITFELCRDLVDDYIIVSEEEIKAGMRFILEHHHQAVEGAAGVAVAALAQRAGQFADQTVAVVLCGGNVGVDTLKEVMQ